MPQLHNKHGLSSEGSSHPLHHDGTVAWNHNNNINIAVATYAIHLIKFITDCCTFDQTPLLTITTLSHYLVVCSEKRAKKNRSLLLRDSERLLLVTNNIL